MRTKNYDLYICDDGNEKFEDWRKNMGGTDDTSNMVKIDAILNEKSNKSKVVYVTLLESQWEGNTPPYTQTISVTGLGADQNGIVDISHNATLEQRNVARDIGLSIIGQSNGTLTLSADKDLPEVDIPIYIILLD